MILSRKFIAGWLFILVGVLIFPMFSYAQGSSTSGQTFGDCSSSSGQSFGPETGLKNPLKVCSLGQAINRGVEIFTYIVILGAVIAFIVVGLRYILARGNTEEVKKMSTWLGYIAIGVAIVLGARLMISIIINTLDQTGAISPTVIQGAQDVIKGK